MSLPLVNILPTPYEAWTSRTASKDDMLEHLKATGRVIYQVRDRLEATVSNPFEAAQYICRVGADIALGSAIESAVSADGNYKTWRGQMPSVTPKALAVYQKEFPHFNPLEVDSEIRAVGQTLSMGQCLFHGGLWPGGSSDYFKTDLPFSTSLCPQVALRNAEHNAKAFNANQIDLFVLRVAAPCANMFVFRRAGTSLGHEMEVLFASGATLNLKSRHLVRNDYPAHKAFVPPKLIPAYVLEVELS